MCDPIFLIVGAVVQGVGAMRQQKAAAAAARKQEELANKQADQIEEAGAHKIRQVMHQAARIGGQQRAAAVEGGLALSGSISDVMAASAAEADMDLEAIIWNADASASNKRFEGTIHAANARSASAAAPFAFLSPILRTAAQYPTAFGIP